jgi:hypothetical protein
MKEPAGTIPAQGEHGAQHLNGTGQHEADTRHAPSEHESGPAEAVTGSRDGG